VLTIINLNVLEVLQSNLTFSAIILFSVICLNYVCYHFAVALENATLICCNLQVLKVLLIIVLVDVFPILIPEGLLYVLMDPVLGNTVNFRPGVIVRPNRDTRATIHAMKLSNDLHLCKTQT